MATIKQAYKPTPPKPVIGPTTPPKPQTWAGAGSQVTPPKPSNYQAPGSYVSGVNGGLMGNLPAPAYGNGGYPTPPATQGGGGGGAPAGDMWNGYRVVQRSPGGNVLVDVNGDLQAYDPWGNRIPHLYAGAAGGDPNGGGQNGGGGGGGAAPVATPTTPGVPTPVQGTPTTFYSPTTGSPYLQLGGNFLSYLDNPQRQQLDSALRGAGFQATGAMNTYGPSDYIRPPQFDMQDINNLAVSEPLRQWLRFFLGNYGYGQSYQLPAGYVPGSGLPTPPPMPMPTADPYNP